MYTAELYPTSLRNTGWTLCSLFARFAGMSVAPGVALLRRAHPFLPIVALGAMSAGAALAAAALPETLGARLPQTVAESEGFGGGSGCCAGEENGKSEKEIEAAKC